MEYRGPDYSSWAWHKSTSGCTGGMLTPQFQATESVGTSDWSPAIVNGETPGPPVTEPEQGLTYCPTLSLLSTERASLPEKINEVEQSLRPTLMYFQLSQESN